MNTSPAPVRQLQAVWGALGGRGVSMALDWRPWHAAKSFLIHDIANLMLSWHNVADTEGSRDGEEADLHVDTMLITQLRSAERPSCSRIFVQCIKSKRETWCYCVSMLACAVFAVIWQHSWPRRFWFWRLEFSGCEVNLRGDPVERCKWSKNSRYELLSYFI